MAKTLGSLAFKPVVEQLQERHGSRPQSARLNQAADAPAHLRSDEIDFIGERNAFCMACVGATGEPYVQHRGGPMRFLRVRRDLAIAFVDFSGKKQYVCTGNPMTDDRVASILADCPGHPRLKIR